MNITTDPQPMSVLVPEFMLGMQRIAEKWTAFCEECRPKIELLPQSTNCPIHLTASRPLLVEETCQYSLRNDEFTPVYAPCAECDDAETVARQNRFWSKRGVPQRVIRATFANFKIEEPDIDKKLAAKEKALTWIKANGGFLLAVGSPGTGKGHIASSCLKKTGDGVFITQADMLMDLRSSYSMNTTRQTVERWQDADCFILDEFGLSVGGKDEEPLLYQVLASRHDNDLPTIITSNKTLAELKELLGFRLYDRIAEKCTTLVMNWPSYRTGK